MEELGIGPQDRLVYFGQLLGMCDQVTFPLGEYKLFATLDSISQVAFLVKWQRTHALTE